MFKKVILFVLCFFSFCISCYCQTGEKELYNELKKVDKKLNNVYVNIKKNISKNEKTLLIEKQRIWIMVRDQKCNNCLKEKNNIISNKIKMDCFIQATIDRTKVLKKQYFYALMSKNILFYF